MKNNVYLVLISLLVMSCGGGGNKSESYRPASQGTPYEIVVVASNALQKATPYDTLVAVLHQDVEMVNQSEPIYDVITTVPSNFKNVLKKHRNVFILETGAQFDSTAIKIEHDSYAKPQLVVRLTSPSNDSLASYIWKKKDELITLLDTEERKRIVKVIESKTSKPINDTIKSMFGVSMHIPYGYSIRDQREDFLWLSYETARTSQGIFMYSYFYDPDVKFTQKYAISMRNTFASLVPGPRDSTYMSTSEFFPPSISRTTIDSMEWVVQRGFWDVQNDFMGGPFVSFSILDAPRNRIFVIDTYLYSPFGNKTKRNLLRHLEAIAYTTKFD